MHDAIDTLSRLSQHFFVQNASLEQIDIAFKRMQIGSIGSRVWNERVENSDLPALLDSAEREIAADETCASSNENLHFRILGLAVMGPNRNLDFQLPPGLFLVSI